MRLTRKKIKDLCIDVWEWCAKTGKHKKFWPDWPKWYKKSNNALPLTVNQCWFCYYAVYTTKGTVRKRNMGDCSLCPYHIKYGHCNKEEPHPTYYWKWDEAKTPRTRKKYAKLFLEQIRETK